MPRKAKQNTEIPDWTDHIFEFRKGGVVYETRRRVYVDQADSKKKSTKTTLPQKRKLRTAQKADTNLIWTGSRTKHNIRSMA